MSTRQCPQCRKIYLPELINDADGIKRWQEGELIQNVWPSATTIQREQLKTGLCSDKCWDLFLGVEDDGREYEDDYSPDELKARDEPEFSDGPEFEGWAGRHAPKWPL